MTNNPDRPAKTDAKPGRASDRDVKAEARDKRLKAAWKARMARRKAQTRARADQDILPAGDENNNEGKNLEKRAKGGCEVRHTCFQFAGESGKPRFKRIIQTTRATFMPWTGAPFRSSEGSRLQYSGINRPDASQTREMRKNDQKSEKVLLRFPSDAARRNGSRQVSVGDGTAFSRRSTI